MIKLFGIISLEENSDFFHKEITILLDSINEILKKLTNKEDTQYKMIRNLKIILKFTSVVIKLKSYKLSKIKSMVSESEISLNKKPLEVSF